MALVVDFVLAYEDIRTTRYEAAWLASDSKVLHLPARRQYVESVVGGADLWVVSATAAAVYISIRPYEWIWKLTFGLEGCNEHIMLLAKSQEARASERKSLELLLHG